MKIHAAILSLTVACLAVATAARAQDTTTSTNANEEAFKALITQVKADIKDGKRTDAALSADLQKFDTLLAAEKGQPTDLGAQILFMKSMLYDQVLQEPDKAAPIVAKIKSDYPKSKVATMLARQDEAKKKLAALATGVPFPDFSETSVSGEPISVAKYKGKVVLVDFWATWCGPCRGELPNVVATYGKYHDKGFEIIGVSLDSDKDKLTAFTKDNAMTWPQYFDGQGWGNKLAAKYGVESIPFTVLVDGKGNIIGTNLRGEELTKAVATATGS